MAIGMSRYNCVLLLDSVLFAVVNTLNLIFILCSLD